MSGFDPDFPIDVLSFLEDNDIPFRTEGKNISQGWIGITCPYPDCSDPSFHCGIHLQSGTHNCWICGGKGRMVHLVKILLDISYSKAKSLLEKYPATVALEETEEKPEVQSITLDHFDTFLPALPRDYLISRDFDPDLIQRKYSIRFCYTTGKFAYRIIIPVILNGQIVNFTARDVTGIQEPKYKNLSNEKAVIPIKSCLYNLDSVKNDVIICEGVTDVWRVGNGAIATMGTEYTSAQLELLMEKEVRRAFVLYDTDANKKAEKLANTLSAFIPHVEVITLDEGDPAELSEKEVRRLLTAIKFS
uniref:Putative DNA primase n=1 Tax=viral metagenome TaxID=1070528 RepID=A0A6M3LI92_9ZZZZ